MFRPMRRFKQALSAEECLEVLKEEKRGTLALAGDEGYPYALPINYFYEEASGRIYFHGAGEGHKIDAIRRCDKVSFNVHDAGVKLEGDWAYTVRSVTVFGRLHILEDRDRHGSFAADRPEVLPFRGGSGPGHGTGRQPGDHAGTGAGTHHRETGP